MQNENYQGLNDAEVIESRKLHGENILKELGRRSGAILWEVLKEPMLLILIVASFIYFLTGSIREGIIMLVAIALVSGISLYQQIRSENATKLQIIHALKKMDELVAMTGDGVNDGPALKASHIGIAMGIRGSEVARQAASLILLYENEPMDTKLLIQKPRKLINTFFTWKELSISVIQGIVITAGLMIILFYSIK